MRLRTTAILTTAAFGLAIPASGLAEVSTTIGTGKKTCVLKREAVCNAIKAIRANFAGRNLRGVRFARANLKGADFRWADLRGARFDGAKLRGADFGGAKLKGAYFGPPINSRKGANQAQSAPACYPKCSGADLRGANLREADLSGANLASANLTNATLSGANLTNANLSGANLSGADLSWSAVGGSFIGYWIVPDNPYDDEPRPAPALPENPTDLRGANLNRANLTGTDFTGARFDPDTVEGAKWSNTTCPNGTVTNTGC